MKCEAGAAPEISKTQTKASTPLSCDRRAPAHVVQRRRGIDAQVHPDAVRQQRVDARALVDLVEVRHGEAVEERRARRRRATGGRSGLLSSPSVRSDATQMSFRPCWYWMPIAAQPKSCGHAHGRVVHLQALEDLPLRQLASPRPGRARTSCRASAATRSGGARSRPGPRASRRRASTATAAP